MVKRLFSLIFIAILFVSFTGCSCLNNSDELKKQQVESTINNYFAAMKSHNIDEISKYVSKGIKKLYTEKLKVNLLILLRIVRLFPLI